MYAIFRYSKNGEEVPSYIGAISAFRNYQAELVGVRQGNDGIDLGHLSFTIEELKRSGRRIKMIYIVPNFQNPSGITLSMDKRKALLDLAGSLDMVIVEDDPYGDVYFNVGIADQLSPLKAFDKDGRVIYLSTFSKTLSPGLRTGWIVAPEPVIQKLDMAKQAADLCGSMLDQRIVAECWRSGIIQCHLPQIRNFYRSRCQAMLASMEALMPGGIRWTRPAGGLFLWVWLPESLESEKILNVAFEEEKVTFVIGSPFFVNGEGHNMLRLAFSKENEDNIHAGIHKLAKVFKAHLE